jgi:RNA polymerase sigma-70 factor (ECF subfamily)
MPESSVRSATSTFEGQRRRLMGVSYRILGSVVDAEDVVQDAWLRWSATDVTTVKNPEAFLTTVVSRLSLDRLRTLKARREVYSGPWLPEPVATAPDAAEAIEVAESVSLALLIVLETLSPLERAVFVLREAFGYSNAEIAGILGRSESAVRQLSHRARLHVDERRPRFDADEATRRLVTERFLVACETGDPGALLGVLAPDVVLVGDGGDQAKAPRRPIVGADKVARFLLAIWAEAPPGVRVLLARVNGDPGIVAGTESGDPVGTMVLDVADGVVRTIYMVVNPDKLGSVRLEPSPLIR